jgi:sugar/nucleoside kinase (ribokinase family)
MTAIRVGVLGAAASDQIVQADGSILRRRGGSPLYAARALRAAGAEPVAIETGALVSYLDHTSDGTRQQILSLPEPLDADRTAELLPRLGGCEWVVLGGQTAGDFPPESIALLAGAGHKICLDAQGLARGSRIGPVQLGPIDPGWVEGVTALKLNDAEARASGPLTAPELLVTMAERGCTVTAAGIEHHLPGSGERFVDPTGAGDSFGALYCLARSGGSRPDEAAAWAQERVQQLYVG